MATYNPYLENPLFYGYGREHKFFNDLPPSPLDSISTPNTPVTPPLPQAQSPLDALNSEGGPNVGVPGAGVNNQFGSLGMATSAGNFVGSGIGALLGVPGVGQLVGGLVGAGMGATAAQLTNQALDQLGISHNLSVGNTALSGFGRGALGTLGGVAGFGSDAINAMNAANALSEIQAAAPQLGLGVAQDLGMIATGVMSPAEMGGYAGGYGAEMAGAEQGGGYGLGGGEYGGDAYGLAGGGMLRDIYGRNGPTAPRMLSGPGGGLDDLIPMMVDGRQLARASDGEFVIPADVVSAIGDGSSNAGGRRLFDMIKEVRRQKHGTTEQPGRIQMGPLRERLMA